MTTTTILQFVIAVSTAVSAVGVVYALIRGLRSDKLSISAEVPATCYPTSLPCHLNIDNHTPDVIDIRSFTMLKPEGARWLPPALGFESHQPVKIEPRRTIKPGRRIQQGEVIDPDADIGFLSVPEEPRFSRSGFRPVIRIRVTYRQRDQIKHRKVRAKFTGSQDLVNLHRQASANTSELSREAARYREAGQAALTLGQDLTSLIPGALRDALVYNDDDPPNPEGWRWHQALETDAWAALGRCQQAIDIALKRGRPAGRARLISEQSRQLCADVRDFWEDVPFEPISQYPSGLGMTHRRIDDAHSRELCALIKKATTSLSELREVLIALVDDIPLPIDPSVAKK